MELPDGYVLLLDGEPSGWTHAAEALGFPSVDALLAVFVELLNGDPRTNPPKVEMVPWAEVDTRPGKHLPAEGNGWNDFRTRESAPSLVAYKDNFRLKTYSPGSSVPVRSSDGGQA